jgi:uncharacterized protein
LNVAGRGIFRMVANRRVRRGRNVASISGVVGMICALSIMFPAIASAKTSIPPRPIGSVIADSEGMLSQSTIAEIDALNVRLRSERDGAEIGVLVVSTTSGEKPRVFATRAFNVWKLGSKSANNGALVMVAKADRKVELVIGDGVDTAETRATAQNIVVEYITPKFRAGDFDAGVLAGVQQTAQRILALPDAPPNTTLPASSPLDSTAANTELAVTDTVSETDSGSESTDVATVDSVVLPTYTDSATTDSPITFGNTPSSSSSSGSSNNNVPLAVGGGTVGLGGLAVAGRAWMRRRPRKCSKCSLPMTRLGDFEDDTKLTPGQRTEERVGSVDYDVWVCQADGTTQIARHGKLFSRYKQCPSCGSKTKRSSKTTLVAATTSHGGSVRLDEWCSNCKYKNSYTSATARLSQTSSSSHRSSSSGFSSGSSSGGGHSSGGGGSGSW